MQLGGKYFCDIMYVTILPLFLYVPYNKTDMLSHSKYANPAKLVVVVVGIFINKILKLKLL